MWFGYGTDISSLNKYWLNPIDESDLNFPSTYKTNNFVKSQTDRIETKSLRGYLDSKLIAKRRSWDIIISADELSTDAKYNFIKNFWDTGAPHYIDITATSLGTPSNWIEVIVPSGDIPIEFLHGNPSLREINCTILESNGSL